MIVRNLSHIAIKSVPLQIFHKQRFDVSESYKGKRHTIQYNWNDGYTEVVKTMKVVELV